MPRIEFITQANYRGQGYHPGQVIEVESATARAYVAVQQARILEAEPVDEKTLIPTPDPSPCFAPAIREAEESVVEKKKRVRKGGKSAETAELPPGEQR